MFSKVDLKGFRGVKQCKKPINLSKFTLLIGPNNAGKSALLEALSLLPMPYAAYNIPILECNRRQVIQWIHGTTDSLVYRYSGKGCIECICKNIQFNLTITTDYHVELNASSNEEINYPIDVAKRLGRTNTETTEEEKYYLNRYTAFIPRNDKFMDALKAGLFNNWNLVEKTGAHSKVVRNVIAKVVEDRLTEVALKKNDIVVRKEFIDGDSAYIRLDDKGDGVKRFLPAALYLEAVSPKVVLWDDLETAAHPSLISAMIQWLAEHEWQVVASTHSIDVLREFVTLGPLGGKVLSLRKSADDVLTYKELSIEELENLFEVGQDVRKIMEWR